MFIGYLKNGFEDCLEDLINKNPFLDTGTPYGVVPSSFQERILSTLLFDLTGRLPLGSSFLGGFLPKTCG